MKMTLRPLLFSLLALGAAACSGKTNDVYLGSRSGSDSNKSGFVDDTAPSCATPIAPKDVCSIQLSGGTAEDRAKALTTLSAIAALGSDAQSYVSKVYEACSTGAFVLGSNSQPIPIPKAEDARNACAELRNLLVSRGTYRVTNATPTCSDVPRSTCGGVTLPARHVCAASPTVTGPDSVFLQDHVAALFATQAELKSVSDLASLTSDGAASLQAVSSACIPSMTSTVSTATGDISAAANAIADVTAAFSD